MLQPLPGCEPVSVEEVDEKPPETSVAGPSSLEKAFGESLLLLHLLAWCTVECSHYHPCTL